MVVLLLGAALRLPGLAWLPAVNGDEGNWGAFARQLAETGTLEFPAAYRGNSPAFAYLLGVVFKVVGVGVVSLRIATPVLLLGVCAACFWLLRAAGKPRAGVAVAAVLAVHPWSVLWSRTAAVPYALAMALWTLAALAIWVGVRERCRSRVSLGVVGFALAAHLSPLVVIGTVPCAALLAIPRYRWVIRDRRVWAAVLVAVLLVAPLPWWMSQSEVPPASPPATLVGGLLSLARMLAGGLVGEATLRHFTDAALSVGRSTALGLVALTALAAGVLWRGRRGDGLGLFGLAQLGAAAVLLPVLLSSARAWHLPTIDAERYVFVLVPGLSLALGGVAEQPGRVVRWWMPAAFGVMLLVASTRALVPLAWGHGIYRGPEVVNGGACYYGWLTSGERRTPLAQVAQVVSDKRASTVLYDGYALRALAWLLPEGSAAVQFADTRAWRGRRGTFVFVIWSRAAMDPAGSGFVSRAAYMRRLLGAGAFGDTQLERRLHQPDGTPLLEIWSARRLP